MSQGHLGLAYYNGRGVERNDSLEFFWIRKAGKLLSCSEWFVNKGGGLLELDEEASKVMFYFLWNAFGFSL